MGAKIRSWLLIADSSYSGINNKYLEYVQNNESNIRRWKNRICFIQLITLRFSLSLSFFVRVFCGNHRTRIIRKNDSLYQFKRSLQNTVFINQKIFKKYNFLFKEINEPKMQNSFKKKSLYSEFFLRPARKIRLEDLGGTRGTRETRMETGEKGGKRKAWVWKRVVWMQ